MNPWPTRPPYPTIRPATPTPKRRAHLLYVLLALAIGALAPFIVALIGQGAK